MTTRTPRLRAPELTGRRWLNTGGEELSLADLRGKVVLLDFWTFCCINCLHVLDELRPLEERYSDVLVILGVHSPKFEFERTEAAVEQAVERYEVAHPVLDDPDLVTWQAYTARAWPTLAVIDPEGYLVASMSGEGHSAGLAGLLEELILEHEAKGTLRRGDSPYVPPAPSETPLRYPGKAIALPNGGWLVSDSGHHQIVELDADAETEVRRFGTGARGSDDGGPERATFSEPQGLTLLPRSVAAAAGVDIVVADTVNHLLRGIHLETGRVTTLAGTGEQFMVGAADNVVDARDVEAGRYQGPAREVKLSSPWDVLYSPEADRVIVAMAGHHTIWAYDPYAREIGWFAGTMNEGLRDGTAEDAWFSQTSGLARSADGTIWIADSESSALRSIDPLSRETVTAVGVGLFDFGFQDGAAAQARLQHPLGVSVLPDGSIAIADTYNGAVRRFDPESSEVSTLAKDLAEPSDAIVAGSGTDEDPHHLLVVESAAHRLVRIAIPAQAQIVSDGAKQTTRPPTPIAAGTVRLRVPFSVPAGQKLDDRWGDPTWLQVSSTPAELLVSGGGGAEGLERELVLASGIESGTLHITARAAACDGEPGGEIPMHAACHLYQQDWGIPLQLSADGEDELVLDLRGV